MSLFRIRPYLSGIILFCQSQVVRDRSSSVNLHNCSTFSLSAGEKDP